VVSNPANFAFCGVILQVIQSVIEIQAINKYRKRHQMMRHMIDYKNHSLTQPAKPKLLDQVRAVIRCRHYSWRTEKTYVHWIKRFIFFHGKRHPPEMGGNDIFVIRQENQTSSQKEDIYKFGIVSNLNLTNFTPSPRPEISFVFIIRFAFIFGIPSRNTHDRNRRKISGAVEMLRIADIIGEFLVECLQLLFERSGEEIRGNRKNYSAAGDAGERR
jgi:hypothetical protein